MRMAKKFKSSLTYLMAVTATAAPMFHIGDTIEIETFLNGRNDKNFLSDRESIRRYVSTQLPKGTLGEIEKVHQFKPRKGKTQGNTGLYIKVTSGPNAGKRYWVLYRPDRNYLKLYDTQSKETESVQDATSVETQREIGAMQDRETASAEPASTPEADVARKLLDMSLFIKSAGDAPKADCHPSEEPPFKLSPLPIPEIPLLSLRSAEPVTLPRDEAEYYMRSTDSVQADATQIQSLAKKITEGKTDDVSKALAIHDWVAGNVSYDAKAYYDEYLKGQKFSRNYDALSVLSSAEPTAICNGYQNLTMALLRASNIPARAVEGLGHFNGKQADDSCEALRKNPTHPHFHGWVEAWVAGGWMSMDTTADAGTVGTDDHVFKRAPSRKYMDQKAFDASHTRCQVNNYY